MKKKFSSIVYFLAWLFVFSSCNESKNNAPTSQEEKENEEEQQPENQPVTFAVIGDVPYNEEQRNALIDFIDGHNSKNSSEFLVHVGDIKAGKTPCEESIYENVSSILKKSSVPTFIILGDNEYNDCDNPEKGLEFWNNYFFQLHKNWQFEYNIEYQKEREENFSWTENGVTFIGINLVGSKVHDEAEWNKRLSDNATWVKQQLDENKTESGAAIIFAHANIVEVGPEKFDVFTQSFRAAAASYDLPILFIHGDGHSWIQNRPWEEKNILRVQVDNGARAVQVTVDTSLTNPFVFDRDFMD